MNQYVDGYIDLLVRENDNVAEFDYGCGLSSGPTSDTDRCGVYGDEEDCEYEEANDESCHAPIPGLTRVVNPNRFRGAKPYTGTFFFFFFQSLTYACGYTNNFCNNQKSFTYTKELPPEWYPLKSLHIC